MFWRRREGDEGVASLLAHTSDRRPILALNLDFHAVMTCAREPLSES